MWIVDEPWPATISLPTATASLIGIAKPEPVSPLKLKPPEPAVSMPITWPLASTSGPPESPGWMPAFVWIRPVSCSVVPADVVGGGHRPVEAGDRPARARGRTARTAGVPDPDDRVALVELRRVAELGGREPRGALELQDCEVVTSGRNRPRLRCRSCPLPTSVAVICVAPSITWLFVITIPFALTTTPVPAPAPL